VELIHILYEHGLLQLGAARTSLAARDIAGRNRAISKVLGILGELEGSLDHKTGGSISQNLAHIYQYMRRRVVDGNVKQDDHALAEVESLLRTLDEGWTAMQHATCAPAAAPYFHAVTELVAHNWNA
jgi:flagellar protein FliS